MFTSVINVIISLVFIFLIYSLLATAIQEALAALLQRRAKTLHRGIKSMLANSEQHQGLLVELFLSLASFWGNFFKWIVSFFINLNENKILLYERFYEHPLIKNYSENIIFNKPSYLTSENFSTILIDTLKNLNSDNQYATANFRMIRSIVDNYSHQSNLQQRNPYNAIIDSDTYKILNFHLNEAAGDFDVFKYRIEKWYNDTMDRVSGWYKRDTQLWLFILGLSISVSFNVDTIAISNNLSKNKIAAEAIANIAENTSIYKQQNSDGTINKKVVDSIKNIINSSNNNIGLGWDSLSESDRIKIVKTYGSYTKLNQIRYATKANPKKWLGFLLTTFAISLGAPFWFDLLNKFVSIRTAVKTVDSSGSTTKNNSADNDKTDG